MTDTSPRVCESTRYARGACTDDGPIWDVVTWTRARDTDPWKPALRHPACFRHGLAEVDGFASIVGSTRCELVPVPAAPVEPGTAPAAEAPAPAPARYADPSPEIARLWRAAGHDIRDLDALVLGAASVTDPAVALDRTGNVLGAALVALHHLAAPRVDRDDLTVEQWRARTAYTQVHDAIDYLLGRHDDRRPAPKGTT